MIRIVNLLLVMIGLSTAAIGQEVIYSGYEKFDIRGGDLSVVGKVGDKIFTYRTGTEGFFLDAYDDSMVKTATVILDFFPKKIYETKFITYHDRIVVIYQAIEGSKVVQYAALLDEKGRLVKRPVQIAEAKTGFFGPNRDYFSSAVSDDKKIIAIYSAADRSQNLELSCTWMDDQLNIRKRSKATFRAENTISTGEAMLGNDGTLYLSASTPIGSHDYRDQLWVLSIKEGENTIQGAEFPLQKMFATGAYMKMDNVKSRIYVGGFYSEKKAGNYDGVLFGYYDIATQTIQHDKMIAFDDRLKNASGERNMKRAFNDLQVRQLIVKNDGGFVLISEAYFMATRNSNYNTGVGYYNMYSFGPFSTPSVREYHYNDILALSYNPEGNRDWETFVRKEQYSQEDGGLFSSYALINTGGTLGFLYNDFNTSRSRIQLASIDGDGKLSMHGMAAGSHDDPDWLPRSAKQVASKELIVPCLRKRQICFAKILF